MKYVLRISSCAQKTCRLSEIHKLTIPFFHVAEKQVWQHLKPILHAFWTCLSLSFLHESHRPNSQGPLATAQHCGRAKLQRSQGCQAKPWVDVFWCLVWILVLKYKHVKQESKHFKYTRYLNI